MKRIWVALAIALMLTMVLSACGGGGSNVTINSNTTYSISGAVSTRCLYFSCTSRIASSDSSSLSIVIFNVFAYEAPLLWGEPGLIFFLQAFPCLFYVGVNHVYLSIISLQI